MRKSRTYRYSFLLAVILNCWCLLAVAQDNFRYKATLDTVQQNGFYTILLTPALVAACQPQLEDIRIKNEAGKEIPYILQQQNSISVATSILIFPLTATNNSNKIILQNSSGTGTNELVLFIKNTAANRTVTLSGSDDTSHWFVIKENIQLATDNGTPGDNFFMQTISFPYSNYHYFQVSMQGKDLLPLNIFKGGIYRATNVVNDRYDPIPRPDIAQEDSNNKKSYIRLQFNKAYQINRFQFSLSGAKYFNRSFSLYNGNSNYNSLLATGIATSYDSSIQLNLRVKTNSLLLQIDNEDNAPLYLRKVAAYQLPVALVAYLDAGKNYSVYFGNATLSAPAYDLQYFSDSIHAGNNLLTIKRIEKIITPANTTAGKENRNTWLLWSTIIAVLLLLIYFSFTLLKDINRKTTHTDAHL